MTTAGNNNRDAIVVRELEKRFGAFTAVDRISFSVRPGEIFGFLGSNGSGKSTTIRMLCGILSPTSGEGKVAGYDIVTEAEEVKHSIGYMSQKFSLYEDLTPFENLRFYLGFSNLLPFTDRQAGNLSGGMKQKLGLACVLVHEPKLLILDEPTNGVDPVSRQEFWEILGKMRAQGMTIIVSTAYLDEGERCDRLGLMHRAALLETASPAEIRARFENLEEAIIHRIQEADGELEHDTFKL